MNLINEIRSLEAKLRFLRNELESIYEMQTALKAEFREAARMGTHANPVESFVIRIDEYYEEITEISNMIAEKRKKLWLIVSSMPSDKMIDIITFRVKDNCTIRELSERMGISERSIRRYIQQAIELFDKKCNDPFFMLAVDLAYKENLSVHEALEKIS